ncbi:MAG: Uma2 family endonuclease [bacterium]|nr:Uma2 family endonuclease [bacterium]
MPQIFPPNTLVEETTLIATDISLEEYMDKYSEYHSEWINGSVYKKPSIDIKHHDLVGYFRLLFSAYFHFSPIGIALSSAFIMKLDSIPSCREPDVQIIIGANQQNLTQVAMVGASDICIEVVSRGSITVDYDEKFTEYEKGGVKEYWILDPKRRTIDFHRLNADGVYEAQQVHVDNTYKTPLVPNFVLHIPTLWREELPATLETADIVRAMFKED